MTLQVHQNDILAHINPPTSLRAQATIQQACLTVFSTFGISLQLCFEVQEAGIEIVCKLTAFGQSVDLGQATLQVGQSTTLNGSIDDIAKAEVTVSIGSNPLQICFDAKGCVHVPIGGWQCASTGRHCVAI
jgi:hypothetical protein